MPEEAVNPVKKVPDLIKRTLFTKSPQGYYERSLVPDEWRFNGITPTVVSASDPSLGDWPLLSWLGAAQVYFYTPARISKTDRKEKIELPHVVW